MVQYALTECIWQKTSVLDDIGQHWTLGREFKKVLNDNFLNMFQCLYCIEIDQKYGESVLTRMICHFY